MSHTSHIRVALCFVVFIRFVLDDKDGTASVNISIDVPFQNGRVNHHALKYAQWYDDDDDNDLVWFGIAISE